MASKELVIKTTQSNNVVIFSKSYCPFCKKAKAAIFSLLSQDAVLVLELDQREDGDSIQDALQEVTGGRSVPRVFIKGTFFGGGDDTAAAVANGDLERLLKSEGII